MSSSDHPTSNVEDIMSSNSPNYSPATPGKTYSDSSNSIEGNPAFSLFHDDPYMKALQAFYERPTAMRTTNLSPPRITPGYFLPENILTPPPTPTLPQERGEKFKNKTMIEQHEELIENIINHLNEIPLDRIEEVEGKVEGLGKGTIIIQRDFDAVVAELHQAHT